MDYSDPEACLEKLRQLNPTNVDHAYGVLVEMLGALLLGTIPDVKQHVVVLETAREPLGLVQEVLSQRYATHPIPPDAQENQVLLQVVSLWRLMARSYAQIVRRHDLVQDEDNLPALLAQRRVFYAGQVLLEYFRARRELPGEVWAALHKAYQAAEEQKVENVRVADILNEVWQEQSATEAFITILLIDLASPYSRSRRELEWVFRWAQRFAPYCSLEPIEDDVSASKAYGLNLDADQGLRPLHVFAHGAGEHCRRFDGSRLAQQIREMVGHFKQGVKPSALGLGEDTSASASARLLVSLYRPWGLASSERRFTRRHTQGEVELSGDWQAMGFHVQGKIFESPGHSIGNISTDFSLRTFGERVEEAQPVDTQLNRRQTAEKLGLACEYWKIIDESLGGFRLERHSRGARLTHKQLVCILPPGSERFQLGRVSWLMYREDGMLEIGVNLLAGVPKVVAVRQLGINLGKKGVYQQAFLLSATPALKKPATLVLPPSWYQTNRIIEMYDEHNMDELRLTKLIQRGANYDHSEFEPLM